MVEGEGGVGRSQKAGGGGRLLHLCVLLFGDPSGAPSGGVITSYSIHYTKLYDALEHLEEIVGRLRGQRPAVFLDYDGTLTPIVARPELAVLSAEVRSAVRALAGCCFVAVVSGRDRRDVERLVDLDGIVYAGSHGS